MWKMCFCCCDFRKLLEPPYVDSIEWAKWHVFWVDERVVPKTHEDSNYKLAFDGFLSKVCSVFQPLKGLFLAHYVLR